MAVVNSDQRKKYFDSEVSWAAIDLVKRNRPYLALTFLYMYLLFFFIFLTYSLTVKVPIRIEGTGRFTSKMEPVPIKAPASFVVGKLSVKENQDVQKGQVLMISRDTLSSEDKQNLQTYLKKSGELIRNTADPNCTRCEPQIFSLSRLYLSIKAEGDLQALLTPMNDNFREYLIQIQNYNQIESTVSDLRLNIKLNQQKIDQIKKRNAEQMLAREIEQMTSEIQTSKVRIQERFQSSSLAISKIKSLIQSRLVELESKLSLYEKTFNIVAPFAGRVTNLKLKGDGELISSGQALLDLVPQGSELIARVEIRNEDIAQVKIGSDVIISVDSLPELDYGTIPGTVLEILRTENSNQDIQATAGVRTFPVMISLKKQYLEKDGVKSNFLIGMSVRARIVSEYQTIFKSFLINVLKIGEKAGIN